MIALKWEEVGNQVWESSIGDFDGGDGVRFSLQFMPSCYRRGPWMLFIQVAEGKGHIAWGCFDDQDQPSRWYHKAENAKDEAGSIATVLVKDRAEHGPIPNLKPSV